MCDLTQVQNVMCDLIQVHVICDLTQVQYVMCDLTQENMLCVI